MPRTPEDIIRLSGRITLALCAVLFVGFLVRCGKAFNELIGDAGFNRFTREHHLPSGYLSNQDRKLSGLRQAVLSYCQAHDGKFPPMDSMMITGTALTPYLKDAKHFKNRVTFRPYVPNAALNGKRYHDIKSPDNTVLFSDPHPPDTYQEVYYVTVSGKVEHTELTNWEAKKRAMNAAP